MSNNNLNQQKISKTAALRMTAIAATALAISAGAYAQSTTRNNQSAANEGSRSVGVSVWTVRTLLAMKPQSTAEQDLCDCAQALAQGVPQAAPSDITQGTQSASSDVALSNLVLRGLQLAAEKPGAQAAKVCSAVLVENRPWGLELTRDMHPFLGTMMGRSLTGSVQGVNYVNQWALQAADCVDFISSVAPALNRAVLERPMASEQAAVDVIASVLSKGPEMPRWEMKPEVWTIVNGEAGTPLFRAWTSAGINNYVVNYKNGEYTVTRDGMTVWSKDVINGRGTKVAIGNQGSFAGAGDLEFRRAELKKWSWCLLAFNNASLAVAPKAVRARSVPSPASKASLDLLRSVDLAKAVSLAKAEAAQDVRLDVSAGGVRWRLGRYAFDMAGGQPKVLLGGVTLFDEQHAGGEQFTVSARWASDKSTSFTAE